MDYTIAHRQKYLLANPEATLLTIEDLLDLGIPQDTIDASLHIVYGQRRLRLVNASHEYYKVPAVYEHNGSYIHLVSHLQKFKNVGPWSNEHIATSPGLSYRRLDLYLDSKDIDSLIAKGVDKLPKLSTSINTIAKEVHNDHNTNIN